MMLMTKELEKKLPQLRANEKLDIKDISIIIKFFHPFSNWTWYVTEGEKQENGDWLFFGWVDGEFPEMGYFSLNELKSIKIMGLPIERDKYFGDHTIAEAIEKRI